MEAYQAKKGRRNDDDTDGQDRDHFLHDYRRIIQCRAYRRLSDKTQVYSLALNPHIRTRRDHTDEVTAISTEIAEMLGLNMSLCMAIAAGHDIGHPPYGHSGENFLSALNIKKYEKENNVKLKKAEKEKLKFKHNVFSVVVAQHIERNGAGLNLNHETLEGILLHSRGKEKLNVYKEKSQEYSVVMYADKIAYVFADINDARRLKYLKIDPPEAIVLGSSQRPRILKVINALVNESKKKGYVAFSEGYVFECFTKIKNFMYDEIYPCIDWDRQKTLLESTYSFFVDFYPDVDPIIATALMTDREVYQLNDDILKASTKPNGDLIKNYGINELLPLIEKYKKIDFTNPDLDWA